jgi:GTP diphosphokinase / guanosine-3',5'-bis(diphosphate) 3'-diphosphatase
MAEKTTIEGIIKKAKSYLPSLNEDRVMAAYEFAKNAHEGQLRHSGEPYIQHPLEVAAILLTLHPDEDSIVACLLHDVLEDTDKKLPEIEALFGMSISPLLKGLEKLGTMFYHGQERQIENLRKMFLAMAKDIRVILIKLADRLHNMRTLQYIKKEEKRRIIAEETLTVYSPIASRLGIYAIKGELDNLCFKTLYPADYERIMKEMEAFTELQESVIQTSQTVLSKALEKEGIHATVDGRVKNQYSIFKKLKKKDKNYVTELYDVFALRVVVNTDAECYQALGIIHKHWTPLSRRFKDYIAKAKPNGYQSLHTTIVGLCPKLHNQPIEIQIRTKAMNETAEFGIAAHWGYKEGGKDGKAVLNDQKLPWVQNLVELHENLKSNAEFIESLSVDIFHDRIFVLTPRGDVLDLPYDATPVDFAYAVHSSIGHRCKGARVNGKMVPLDYPLKNGQVVEILLGPVDQPNRYWLSFVLTSNAKSKIKEWFNGQDQEKIIGIGKELINKRLKQFNKPPLDANYSIFKAYNGEKLSVKERESLVEKVGNGTFNSMDVLKNVLPMDRVMKKTSKSDMARQVLTESINFEEKPEVLITGEKGFKTQMASCCMPQPNDPIIGYITQGRGVSIHKQSCKTIKGLDPSRLIKTSWSSQKVHEYTAKLRIDRRSRIGLLRDIADVFARNELPILDLENVREQGSDQGYMLITASMDSFETLYKIMRELEQVEGVFRVKEME